MSRDSMHTVRASNSFLLPTLRYRVDGQTRVRYAIRGYEALGYAYWMEADSDEPDAPMARSSLAESGASLGDLAALLGEAANSGRVPLYATEGAPADAADDVYLIPLAYSAKDGEAWVPAIRGGGCWWIVRDRRTEAGWERRRHPLPTALLRRDPLLERMPGRTGKQVLSYSPDAPEPKEVGMNWSYMDALGRRVYRNRGEEVPLPLVPQTPTRPNDAGFSFTQPRPKCDQVSTEPAAFKPAPTEEGPPMLEVKALPKMSEVGESVVVTTNELVYGNLGCCSIVGNFVEPTGPVHGLFRTGPEAKAVEGPRGEYGPGMDPPKEAPGDDSSDGSDSSEDEDGVEDEVGPSEGRDGPARPKPAGWAPSTEFRLRRLSLMDGRRTVAKLRTDGWWRVDLELRPCARIPEAELAPEDAILRAAFNDDE